MGKSTRVIVALFCLLVVGAPVLAGKKDPAKAAIAEFKVKMKKGKERDRIRAVNTLAAVQGPKVSKELRRVLGTDRSEAVKAAAAQAIGRRGEKRDLNFLLAALSRVKKLPIALAGVVDGIGEYGDPKAGKELFKIGRGWMSKHKYPAQAAIRALGKIRHKSAVGYLIKLYEFTYVSGGYLRGPDGDMSIPGPASDETMASLEEFRPRINESLRRLTGEALRDLEIWKEWWEENEKTFDPSKVKLNLNQTLALLDDEFRYSISRPAEGWLWVEKAEPGFSRTAHCTRDGEIEAKLSILAYSTDARSPDTAEAMLAQQRKSLLGSMKSITAQKWDEAVKVHEVKAVRQTIQGEAEGVAVKIQQTVVLHRKTMYVIRVTTALFASRETDESAREFYESFRFLK